MRLALAALAVSLPLGALAVATPTPPTAVERTRANDNRTPAGTLHGGVLTLRLEARTGEWHPDGESAPGAVLPAFAEEGRAPQIPGPLVRVPAGTEVAVTLRNRLGDTLEVHGLHARADGARDEALRLAPGERRAARFRLDAPGTYYYWGTTMHRAIDLRTHEDAQLTGAIVVDPPGARPAEDRVLVIGMWTDTVARAYTHRNRILAVINGRSWPHTERLAYDVGDTVRWRVINASGDAHPMHLHGFYFRVDARGDGLRDTRYAPEAANHVVTEVMRGGATMELTWVPERAGNWLFHCHIPEHISARGPLGTALAPAARASHGADHASGGMGGLVMGIAVRPSGAAPALAGAPEAARRRLRLLVRRNAGGSDDAPYFGFALQEGAAPPPPDSGLRIGPPLVLVRGQPVSITVVNTLAEPTAVHWHGIELESYYDGVAGFSGDAQRLAPAIAPGDSFEVRFTPPRAGTFIYHTHVDEERQELAGLSGPIVVLEPGERYDPARDHTVLITSPTTFEDQRRAVLLNGSLTPAPLVLRAGVTHRLRFINMTLRRPAILLGLVRDTMPAPWRALAKDGATLPTAQQVLTARPQTIGIGETFDVELAADAPGELSVEVRQGGRGTGALFARLPVRVVR